jgi:hypothetical protein
METLVPVDKVARLCHEANREYCAHRGEPHTLDHTVENKTTRHANPALVPWERLDAEHMNSTITGVRKLVEDPHTTPEQLHESWAKSKLDAGWKHGEAKDAVAKTHPCLVPYSELPEDQKRKDHIFRAVALAFIVDPNATAAKAPVDGETGQAPPDDGDKKTKKGHKKD